MCPKRPYKKGDRRKNAALMAIIVPAAIVAFVVVSPFLLYDCLKDTKSSRSKREKERDDRGRFPPRLLERPHALSFVDDESTVERPPSTGPDLKATLLTLPVEIRLLIFEHLIQPESDIHINYTRGRIRSYRCTCRLKGYEVSDYELCRCRYQASRWPNQTRNLTPYLRTCRAM